MTEEVRVGARQWQVLGAIAQVPGETIRTKDLYVHVRYHAGHQAMRHILDVLQVSGLIAESEDEGTVRLTERGATVKRVPGKPGIPWFCLVDKRVLTTADR